MLPFPICGGEADVKSWWSESEECGKAWVGCSRESYTGGYECARICIMRCDEKAAMEDAILIWNTRTAAADRDFAIKDLEANTCRNADEEPGATLSNLFGILADKTGETTSGEPGA